MGQAANSGSEAEHRTSPLVVSLPAPHNRGSAPPALVFNSFKQSPLSQGQQLPKGKLQEQEERNSLSPGADKRERQAGDQEEM